MGPIKTIDQLENAVAKMRKYRSRAERLAATHKRYEVRIANKRAAGVWATALSMILEDNDKNPKQKDVV